MVCAESAEVTVATFPVGRLHPRANGSLPLQDFSWLKSLANQLFGKPVQNTVSLFILRNCPLTRPQSF